MIIEKKLALSIADAYWEEYHQPPTSKNDHYIEWLLVLGIARVGHRLFSVATDEEVTFLTLKFAKDEN